MARLNPTISIKYKKKNAGKRQNSLFIKIVPSKIKIYYTH